MSLLSPVPLPIEEGSYQALEWPSLLELVAGFAQSTVARGWLVALRPSQDIAWIGREHALVQEMAFLLREAAVPPILGLFDPSELAAVARISGAALDLDQIRALLVLIDSLTAWRALLAQPPDALAAAIPALMAFAPSLSGAETSTDSGSELGSERGAGARAGIGHRVDLGELARSLRARLNPDCSLADNASPALRRIRREIEQQRETVAESLRRTLRQLSAGGETQEELITIRGERFVIPVKAEFKRRIPGIVHGESSSGQTAYLEPLETIEQNNELVRLLDEEQEETHRILLEMTAGIGRAGEAIVRGAASLAELDGLSARARFSAAYTCVRPQFSPAAAPSPAIPTLVLEEARHPLLEQGLRAATAHAGTVRPSTVPPGSFPSAIVPLTIRLKEEERQLIISGPNTGGKTVALKTAGLLSMMAQAGIPVPAGEAILPLFTAFLADIGDAQSIESGLSSFSAHITNLNRISRLAGPSSLVLLDEIGSATDPEEGAALAVALAGHFLDCGAWCLISTHLTSLKIYAAEHRGVVNGSVGFDERTLTPTYELRLGVPGASAGINIAQRLGLDESIVRRARASLNTQTKNIAVFLDRLHSDLDRVERERSELRAREEELAREKRRLEAEGLVEWRAKLRELEKQMQVLLEELASRVRQTVQAVGERALSQKLSKDAEARVARLRREFSERFQQAAAGGGSGAGSAEQASANHSPSSDYLPIGSTVRLRSLGQNGKIVRHLDGDLFEIAVGAMKMRVPREEITAAGELPAEAARRRGISVSLADTGEMRPEINVIGRRADEAVSEVEQFLDRAFMAGLMRVRIVHGMGMGVLRRALRSMLEKHPHVVGIEEADQREGGAGATVVNLRQ